MQGGQHDLFSALDSRIRDGIGGYQGWWPYGKGTMGGRNRSFGYFFGGSGRAVFCSQIEVAVAVVVTAEHVGERYERGLGAYGRFGSGVWGEGEGLPDLSQKNAEIEIEVGSRVWGSFMDERAPCQKQLASMGGRVNLTIQERPRK